MDRRPGRPEQLEERQPEQLVDRQPEQLEERQPEQLAEQPVERQPEQLAQLSKFVSDHQRDWPIHTLVDDGISNSST